MQDIRLFERIRQSGQWWVNPWWLKEDSKYTKDQTTVAFQKLKDTFDDEWLKRQFVMSNPHPICGDLLGSYPFVLDYLLKLGLDLKEIENCKNVDGVIKNLKKAREYVSIHSIIEVSAELKRKGFDILFEPRIVSNKLPDFCTEEEDGRVYFEIKTLHTSAYERIEGELMEKVHQNLARQVQHLFLEVYLETCPDFWKRINVGTINPSGQLPMGTITTIDKIAKNIVQSALNKINSGELPCKIEIEKVMIAIERRKDKKPRISMSVRSPEFEFRRAIRNLINKAIGQLPSDSPGMIGIKLFMLESSLEGNRDLAIEIFQREFSKTPSKYAHIAGIVLVLSSYPVQYEKRIIVNPHTKFKNIGQNYRALWQ